MVLRPNTRGSPEVTGSPELRGSPEVRVLVECLCGILEPEVRCRPPPSCQNKGPKLVGRSAAKYGVDGIWGLLRSSWQYYGASDGLLKGIPNGGLSLTMPTSQSPSRRYGIL